jgi:O-acetyl-ADP-ribose deacetylase (regulator of RNase III)
MTLTAVRGDITRLTVECIVNAANERMLGGGGVDGAIHNAAGPALKEACRAIPEVRFGVRCPTGEARITPAFNLPAKYVIHTVGPVWSGGSNREAELLRSCYRACLRLASEHGAQSIAFPAISTGVYGYPLHEAARIAVSVCREYPSLTILLVGYAQADVDALTSALARDSVARIPQPSSI